MFSDLSQNDVVQIDPGEEEYGGYLAVVKRIWTWGIFAAIQTLDNKKPEIVSLNYGEFQPVGRLIWKKY